MNFTSSKETWLHRVNPTIKLFGLIVLCIAVLWVDDLGYMVSVAIGVLLLFICFTGHPLKRIVLLLFPFAFIFISTSSAMILFGKGEITWMKWGLVHITEESFLRGMLVGCRALIFAGLGLTFSLTTKPVSLFYSLMQQVKLKPKYAYSFMAALRLIPIIMEEFQTIRNSMKVRGVSKHKGLGGNFLKIKAYAVPLLAGSIRRAHRIAVAMEAKQFSGGADDRTYYYEIGFSRNDYGFILYFIGLLIVGYAVTRSLPYLSF